MNGRKRHLLVDTGGFLLKVVVHPADVQDRDGGLLVLADILTACPELRHLWVDAGYRGRFVDWVEARLAWSVAVVKHWWTGVRAVWAPAGFHVVPRRWVVERTIAWLAGPGARARVMRFSPLPKRRVSLWR